MPKTLLRFIALILLPCLIADPASCRVLADWTLPAQRTLPRSGLFNQQALQALGRFFPRVNLTARRAWSTNREISAVPRPRPMPLGIEITSAAGRLYGASLQGIAAVIDIFSDPEMTEWASEYPPLKAIIEAGDLSRLQHYLRFVIVPPNETYKFFYVPLIKIVKRIKHPREYSLEKAHRVAERFVRKGLVKNMVDSHPEAFFPGESAPLPVSDAVKTLLSEEIMSWTGQLQQVIAEFLINPVMDEMFEHQLRIALADLTHHHALYNLSVAIGAGADHLPYLVVPPDVRESPPIKRVILDDDPPLKHIAPDIFREHKHIQNNEAVLAAMTWILQFRLEGETFEGFVPIGEDEVVDGLLKGGFRWPREQANQSRETYIASLRITWNSIQAGGGKLGPGRVEHAGRYSYRWILSSAGPAQAADLANELAQKMSAIKERKPPKLHKIQHQVIKAVAAYSRETGLELVSFTVDDILPMLTDRGYSRARVLTLLQGLASQIQRAGRGHFLHGWDKRTPHTQNTFVWISGSRPQADLRQRIRSWLRDHRTIRFRLLTDFENAPAAAVEPSVQAVEDPALPTHLYIQLRIIIEELVEEHGRQEFILDVDEIWQNRLGPLGIHVPRDKVIAELRSMAKVRLMQGFIHERRSFATADPQSHFVWQPIALKRKPAPSSAPKVQMKKGVWEPSGPASSPTPEASTDEPARITGEPLERLEQISRAVAHAAGDALGLSPEKINGLIESHPITFYQGRKQPNPEDRSAVFIEQDIVTPTQAFTLLHDVACERGRQIYRAFIEDPQASPVVAEAYRWVVRLAVARSVGRYYATEVRTAWTQMQEEAEELVFALESESISPEHFQAGASGQSRRALRRIAGRMKKQKADLGPADVYAHLSKIAEDFFWIAPQDRTPAPSSAEHILGARLVSSVLARTGGNWKAMERLFGRALSAHPRSFRSVREFEALLDTLGSPAEEISRPSTPAGAEAREAQHLLWWTVESIAHEPIRLPVQDPAAMIHWTLTERLQAVARDLAFETVIGFFSPNRIWVSESDPTGALWLVPAGTFVEPRVPSFHAGAGAVIAWIVKARLMQNPEETQVLFTRDEVYRGLRRAGLVRSYHRISMDIAEWISPQMLGDGRIERLGKEEERPPLFAPDSDSPAYRWVRPEGSLSHVLAALDREILGVRDRKNPSENLKHLNEILIEIIRGSPQRPVPLDLQDILARLATRQVYVSRRQLIAWLRNWAVQERPVHTGLIDEESPDVFTWSAFGEGGWHRRGVRRRLMPVPVLDASGGTLQTPESGPAQEFAVLERGSSPGRPSGWVPDAVNSQMDTERSQRLADLLYEGVGAHVRSVFTNPADEFDRVMNQHPDIRIEIRRNSFEEEVVFKRKPGGKGEIVRILLDPSLFEPGMETRLKGALFEAAGWLVHGRKMPQHQLTARTWPALLMSDVPVAAFLKAYGHLSLGMSSAGGAARTLRQVLRKAGFTQESVGMSLDTLSSRLQLVGSLEWVVLGLLEEIDRQFPGSRLTPGGDARLLMPVPSQTASLTLQPLTRAPVVPRKGVEIILPEGVRSIEGPAAAWLHGLAMDAGLVLADAAGLNSWGIDQLLKRTQIHFYTGNVQSTANEGGIDIVLRKDIRTPEGVHELLKALWSEWGHQLHQVHVEDIQKGPEINSAVAEFFDKVMGMTMGQRFAGPFFAWERTMFEDQARAGHSILRALRARKIRPEAFEGDASDHSRQMLGWLAADRGRRLSDHEQEITHLPPFLFYMAWDLFYTCIYHPLPRPLRASHYLGAYLARSLRNRGPWNRLAHLSGRSVLKDPAHFQTLDGFSKLIKDLRRTEGPMREVSDLHAADIRRARERLIDAISLPQNNPDLSGQLASVLDAVPPLRVAAVKNLVNEVLYVHFAGDPAWAERRSSWRPFFRSTAFEPMLILSALIGLSAFPSVAASLLDSLTHLSAFNGGVYLAIALISYIAWLYRQIPGWRYAGYVGSLALLALAIENIPGVLLGMPLMNIESPYLHHSIKIPFLPLYIANTMHMGNMWGLTSPFIEIIVLSIMIILGWVYSDSLDPRVRLTRISTALVGGGLFSQMIARGLYGGVLDIFTIKTDVYLMAFSLSDIFAGAGILLSLIARPGPGVKNVSGRGPAKTERRSGSPSMFRAITAAA